MRINVPGQPTSLQSRQTDQPRKPPLRRPDDKPSPPLRAAGVFLFPGADCLASGEGIIELMDMGKLRAWWFSKQGLDGSGYGLSPREVLGRAGWARSVGGANPYLTLFARAGTTRTDADQAVADLEIHELPSARGCTYVLPSEDFALGLSLSGGTGDSGDMTTAVKFLGVTHQEIELLGEKIVDALRTGPLDPRELKTAVGDAARNLGEEGKKRGVTTTLPLALGRLQSSGDIRRVPINGRLDQQRYKYVAWDPNPVPVPRPSLEQSYAALADKYFRWIGPAKLAHFQWFSGLGVGATKSAVAEIDLVDLGDGWLIHGDEADRFAQFKCPTSPIYALVSSLDGILLHRRDANSLIDPDDMSRQVPGEKGELTTIGGIQDLVCNAILDRGRVAGLWEYDPEAGELVWSAFTEPGPGLSEKLKQMEAFVKDQLGDCRSFSLDSPESRKPKLEGLRKMA